MPYTNGFMLSCVLVSMAFITALLLVSLSTNAIYGQVQNQSLALKKKKEVYIYIECFLQSKEKAASSQLANQQKQILNR